MTIAGNVARARCRRDKGGGMPPTGVAGRGQFNAGLQAGTEGSERHRLSDNLKRGFVLKPHWLLLLAVALSGHLFAPSAVAGDLPADETGRLQDLIEQQQKTIQRLEENQAGQASEIEDLKRRIKAGDAVQPSSEDIAKEPPAAKKAPADAADSVKMKTTPAGLTVSIGGHINRAINFVDDGNRSETYFVDSSNFPTLLYVKGSKQYNDDLTVGGRIEYSLQQNAATSVSQDNQDAGFATSSRFFELTADSKRYGKLSFGRGLMSSFLAVEVDQSRTWAFNQLSTGNSFGGIKFVNHQDNSLSNIPVSAIFLDIEAFSFRDRIRYDSPAWHGLQVSGSVGSGNSGDVTLRWNKQLGDFTLFAGGSVQNNALVGRIEERIDGGIGIYHAPTGLNFSAAFALQDYTREFYQSFNRTEGETDGWTTRAGIRRNWFQWGESRFAVDFSRINDALYGADQAESVGVFFGQVIDALNMELYGGYRYYTYDAGPNSGGLNLRDIHAFTVGARIAFDATFSPAFPK